MIALSDRKYWYRGKSWLCPECGRRIAKAKTPLPSARGLLRMHAKWKHSDSPSLEPVMEVST